MAADLEKLIDEISNMTVLELSELVKALEDKFGVSASAAPAIAMPGMMPAAPAAADGEEAAEAEEQTEFDVQLKDFGAKKIPVIKEGSRDYWAWIEGSERESRIRTRRHSRRHYQRGRRENERTTRSSRCRSRNYIDGNIPSYITNRAYLNRAR